MKKTFLSMAVLLWVLPGAAQTQTGLPDTPAARALAKVLAFIDSGDGDGFGRFAKGAFTEEFLRAVPADQMAQHVVQLHENTSGLEVETVQSRSDDEIEINARARRNPDYKAHMVLRLSSSHLIAELRLGILDPARQPHPYVDVSPKASVAERIAAIDREVQARGADGQFSGGVLIAQGEKVLLQRAVGLADQSFAVPNTAETKFHIGSQTKMFTAVAAAQLAAEGRLKFGDPMGKYLTDYPDRAVASQITVDQLLTHTSGLGDFQTPDYDRERWQLHGLADLYRFFANQPLRFAPGKGWGYSNAGMMLVGLIVERVSGSPYTDYIREHVFRPAGMQNSGFDAVSDVTSNLAVGYTHATEKGSRQGPLRSNLMMIPNGNPAGGAYSTTGDMLRFAAALRAHRLLDGASTELVTAAHVKAEGPPELFYGYGFRVVTINGQRAYGHGGSVPGGNSELFIFPDMDLTVIALANDDPPSASRIVTPICELLTGAK
jgi:CubicO group peptidase (beta-lactamase class C family)